jgi:hypothetical protein
MKNLKNFPEGRTRLAGNAMRMILILSITVFPVIMNAQAFNGLVALDGCKTPVYFSAGNQERAEELALRIDNVTDWYYDMLGIKPLVTLLILDPQDWSKFTNFPVYGMPHYKDDKTLVVASVDNEFWKSFIPPVDKLPAGLATQIRETYSDKNGNLSMGAFFDLLAIHELGHAFHFRQGLNMQRKWMAELFVNLFLHTYIAENEPGMLPALTVFPKMVIAGDRSSLKYTSLIDLENRYDEIGQQYPQNYGWYQSRWHSAAADIYDAGGSKVLLDFWNALDNQKDKLEKDTDLAGFLAKNVHQSVADVLLKWDD